MGIIDVESSSDMNIYFQGSGYVTLGHLVTTLGWEEERGKRALVCLDIFIFLPILCK